MCGRDKAYDVALPATDRVQGVNDGDPTELWDMETQSRRKATINDLVDFTIVCDAMPEVDLYWPGVVATDLPPKISNLHEYAASACYTGKHVQHGAGDVTDARYLIQLASAIVGSEDELRKRPIISITHTPITPLRFEKGDIEAAVVFSRAGLPVVHLSMAVLCVPSRSLERSRLSTLRTLRARSFPRPPHPDRRLSTAPKAARWT